MTVKLRVRLYPTAGEATLSEGWRSEDPPDPDHAGANRVARAADTRPPFPDRPAATYAAPLDTDRAEANDERAERRARGKVRRFATANACTRLLTVTRADQTHSPRVMLDALAEFQRRLRERYPRLVWVRALERHKSGAIHAHYALSHRLEHATVARLWPHGFVWLSPKTRTKRGGREDARVTARYVAKYVGKAAVREGAGGHRYEVRQGHQPPVLEFWADDEDDARAIGSAVMDYAPLTYAWTSSGTPDWAGPPAGFLSW